MENNIYQDIGEEIILKLKQLNELLERRLNELNEKECKNPFYG
ncbi:MAG: hypothetical protein PHF67_04305 [Candidatus Nanoarchaeia archaeon]|nr:hypothetical protein [Candidatus Nanoarchaeia archaeon]